MFDFSWSELLVIGVVALVVIGPKELPSVLRTLGQWMSKIRRMASEFQNQFHDAMREAELADLKKEVEQMAKQASDYTIDPLADTRKNLEMAQRDIEGAVAGTPLERPSRSSTAPIPSAQNSSAEPSSEESGTANDPASASQAPPTESAAPSPSVPEHEPVKDAAEPPPKPSGVGSTPA